MNIEPNDSNHGQVVPSEALTDTSHAAGFAPTHWSVVLTARGNSPKAAEALATLCRDYWLPLYAYARRRGQSAHDAEDLTQSFFARLIERRLLSRVEPQGGRFRSYLLTSFQNFMADDWRKARAEKRGSVPALSLDAADAEEWYRIESAGALSSDQVFARRWALSVLEKALEKLRTECLADGKEHVFEQLHAFLSDAPAEGAYDQARCWEWILARSPWRCIACGNAIERWCGRRLPKPWPTPATSKGNCAS